MRRKESRQQPAVTSKGVVRRPSLLGASLFPSAPCPSGRAGRPAGATRPLKPRLDTPSLTFRQPARLAAVETTFLTVAAACLPVMLPGNASVDLIPPFPDRIGTGPASGSQTKVLPSLTLDSAARRDESSPRRPETVATFACRRPLLASAAVALGQIEGAAGALALEVP